MSNEIEVAKSTALSDIDAELQRLAAMGIQLINVAAVWLLVLFG